MWGITSITKAKKTLKLNVLSLSGHKQCPRLCQDNMSLLSFSVISGNSPYHSLLSHSWPSHSRPSHHSGPSHWGGVRSEEANFQSAASWGTSTGGTATWGTATGATTPRFCSIATSDIQYVSVGFVLQTARSTSYVQNPTVKGMID